MGIEPTWPAWKAGVLPLNYTRLIKLAKNPEKSAHCKNRSPPSPIKPLTAITPGVLLLLMKPLCP